MTYSELVKQDISDIRALLQTREGARFFARLMDLCGIYRISYIPKDTHTTAFNEGQRNIGNIVLADMVDTVEYYTILIRGAAERKIDKEE